MMGHYTTRARTLTFPGFGLKTFHWPPLWDADTYMMADGESWDTGDLFPRSLAWPPPGLAGVR
jgi:hypothetical protein